MKASIERNFVTLVAVVTPAIVVVVVLNTLIRAHAPALGAGGQLDLALGVSLACLAAILAANHKPGTGAVIAAGSTVALLAAAMSMALRGGSFPLALPLAGALTAQGVRWVLSRLPGWLDGVWNRRRGIALLWLLLGLVTMAQTARLSFRMADPDSPWWLTNELPLWANHECLVAFIYAADLNRQGVANVYDGQYYPGLNPEAEDRSTVENLVPDDPFQYPPPFLLLPRLALYFSNDFLNIRTVWFGIQSLAFLLTAFLLARWFHGPQGRAAALLIPLLWIAPATMYNFMYGQVQVPTYLLAVGAFLAFEGKRSRLGGGLLAGAILAKGFPGILLIPLVMQKRWKAIGWTAAFGVGFTLLGLVVLGWEPYHAFFTYQLPRMRTGEAFAFLDVWPELRVDLLAGNLSPYCLVQKLGELRLPGATESVARTVHGFYGFLVIGAAALVGTLRPRKERVLAWLALLVLASMTSPGAWGDYVPFGVLWILTFITVGAPADRGHRLFLGICWIFAFLLLGAVPLVSHPSPPITLTLSILHTLLLVAFSIWVILRARRGSLIPT